MMLPQELTALGAFAPCLPSQCLRVLRARRALHTMYHGFMLARWLALLPQSPCVVNILPRFSCFFHIIMPVMCRICDWSFAFSPSITSDVCDVKPLVTVPFLTLIILYWKALEGDCAMLFNVLTYCNISIWAPSAHSWETETVLKAYRLKENVRCHLCSHWKLPGSCQYWLLAVHNGFQTKVVYFLLYCTMT